MQDSVVQRVMRILSECRGSGATERELEALAIYMGHSLDMQRGTYDRCALLN